MRTRAAVLIGRTAELAAATSGPACFLVGEPGVGKSRLLAEAAQHASDAGLVVARGRASAIGPVSPLRPFAEALAGIQRGGLLPDDHLGGYRPLLARVLPQLSGPAPGEAPPLVAFAEAVLRLLATLGRSAAGCLLVLEDLHDADPDTLAVLDYLLDNATGSPVTLLGALRDEPSAARELLVAAERRGAAELLPIRPLDRAHTDLLVAACLGSDQPAEQVGELAWRNTAGNSLAVEELLYHLIDDGQLHRRGEVWQLSPDAVPAPPPSILQLIGTRVDRLGGVPRRLLVTAASYGEQFPPATVQRAVGVTEPEFLNAIQVILGSQLIIADRAGWYRFHHPLTHVAALGLAGPAERRQAAAALAEAVLAENPELTGTTSRLAARLLADAGQPARASELYAKAGTMALDSGAIEWAVADLSEALRLQPPGEQPEELIEQLVKALNSNCQLDRALDLVNGLPLPGEGLDRRWRALTHLALASSCLQSGRVEHAWLQLGRTRSLLAEAEDELIRTWCGVLTAWIATSRTGGSPDTERLARSAASAAERLARTGTDSAERDRAAEAACRACFVLLLLRGTTDSGAADSYLARIRTLATRHGLTAWRHFARWVSLQQQWLADGDDLPLRVFRDQAREAGRIREVLYTDLVLWLHQMTVVEGSLAPVIAGLADCAEQGRRLGHPVAVQSAVGGMAMAAGFRADRAALTGTLARYGITDPLPDLEQDLGMAWACCLTLEGRDGEALATLQDLAQRKLIGPYYDSFALGLLLLLGTVAGTTSAEEVTAAMVTSGRIRWTRQFLHWAAAVQAGRRGDLAEAQRHATQAAAEAEIYPVARHLAARLVAPAGYADGWGTPIEDVRAAEAWFHEQGIAVAARSCRDVLRSLGVPVRQRRDGTAGIPAELRAAGITAREYEVGLLVREHLGNLDIGARLHISPRTVEKHIAALRSKLDLPDRRALIARLADVS